MQIQSKKDTVINEDEDKFSGSCFGHFFVHDKIYIKLINDSHNKKILCFNAVKHDNIVFKDKTNKNLDQIVKAHNVIYISFVVKIDCVSENLWRRVCQNKEGSILTILNI